MSLLFELQLKSEPFRRFLSPVISVCHPGPSLIDRELLSSTQKHHGCNRWPCSHFLKIMTKDGFHFRRNFRKKTPDYNFNQRRIKLREEEKKDQTRLEAVSVSLNNTHWHELQESKEPQACILPPRRCPSIKDMPEI